MGDGAPFVHARCRGMLGGCLGGPARACGASARRHSQLHRWVMQRLHTRRGAAILHPISQRAARIEGMALCTRARRVRIARRGDRTVNYGRAMPGQQTVRRPRTVPLLMPAFHSEGKLIRVPMEAYLKPHPRNTLSSHSGIGALFCSGTDAADPRNARSAVGHTQRVTTNEAVAAPVPPS